jgi:hypothetical protein
MHTGTSIFLSNPTHPGETLPSNTRSRRHRRGARRAPSGVGAFHPSRTSSGHTHLGVYGTKHSGSTYLGHFLHLSDGPPAASAAGRHPWGAIKSPHGARLSAGAHASARVPWGAEANPYGPRGGLGSLEQTTMTYEQFQALQAASAPPPPTAGEQTASIITAGSNALAQMWGQYQTGVAQRQAYELEKARLAAIAAGAPATTVGLTTPGAVPPPTGYYAPPKKDGMEKMMLPLLAVGAAVLLLK